MLDGTYLKLGNGYHARLETEQGYWVATHETTLEDTKIGELFGIWSDNDTFYFDSVVFCSDLETAIAKGRHHGQLAIWDNANNKEVRL